MTIYRMKAKQPEINLFYTQYYILIYIILGIRIWFPFLSCGYFCDTPLKRGEAAA